MGERHIVIFEGMPGSGKTTLAKRLENHFKGKALVFPELSHPLTLPQEDVQRWYMRREEERGALISGNIASPLVIIDRGYVSVFSYMQSVGEEFYFDPMEMVQSLYTPSLVFYFDLSPEESIARRRDKKEDRQRYRIWYKEDFLERYREYSKKFVNLYGSRIILMDGSQPLGSAYLKVRSDIEQLTK